MVRPLKLDARAPTTRRHAVPFPFRRSLPVALRLTGPDALAAPGPLAEASPPRAAAVVAARAGTLLHAGDLAGYRGLFSEVAGWEDVAERDLGRRLLVEAALAAREGSVAVLAGRLAAVGAELVAVLEDEPREPWLLNHAGVALYELGEIRSAEALFTAARRLDPELGDVERNLSECARRRRAGTATPQGLPPAVLAVLRDLAPRAKRIAAAARPATGLTLSLCMIVKDEEAMLGKCLASVAGAVDEIVVVDTGSSDRTVEIAQAHGARVLHHAWTGDFSEARNASFDAATGDWILYLDADEVLVDGDAEALRALTTQTWREAFFLVETNHTGELESGTATTHDALRVFRNRPGYRFSGRIHEQIIDTLPSGMPDRIARTSVRLEHYGYLGAVRDAKGKSRRNIELLERQIADGEDSPFLHYNLGSEHMAAGDHAAALEHLREAWDGLTPEGEVLLAGFAPSLATRLMTALRVCGELEEVDEVAAQSLRAFPGFTDVLYEQAQTARVAGDEARAVALLEQCLEWGDASSAYSPHVGCGTHLAALSLAAIRVGAGDRAGAATLLRQSLAFKPGFPPSLEALAGVLLRQRRPVAEVLDEVQELSGGELAPSVRFLVAVAVYEAGWVVDAERMLREIVAAQPSAGPARVALAEALLSQGRLEEAAEAAAAVDEQAGVKGAALRTEIFARLALGADAGDAAVGSALAAADGRLPAPERRALAAWAGADRELLPGASAPALELMLDVLARLQAFDAFERLAAVLEHTAIPERDKRERLAQVYLRRGFLDSAADEWLGVCDRLGADAAALAGLAEVAARRGLDEDAELLRREAELLAA
jgi:tetratricopeptide (TPR) repeat protein